MNHRLLTLGLVLSFAGCASDPVGRQAVYGTVSVGGKPVEQGTIAFTPAKDQPGNSAAAAIDSGSYSIPAGAGLKPGTYIATITPPLLKLQKPGTGAPAKSAPPVTHEQTVVVGNSSTQLDFQLP